MCKHSFYGFLGLALISFIFISSCENPGNSLEESVAPYLELQAVEGASNVNMTVNRGSAQGLDSYFAVNFSNLAATGIVTEELSEGWCLDYQRPIKQNNDVHAGVKMFNTFGSDNWKSANYLMNIKDELKQNDPSLTYKEIQVALWSLIDVPAFNIDKALKEGSMPSRMLTNGTPNFDVEKTKAIVNKVQKEVDSFVYKPGTPVIVYSKTSDEQQPVGGVYGETAWAFVPNPDGSVNGSKSTQFCDDSNFQGNNWGWTNGEYSNGDSGTFDLIAGAGQCDLNNGTLVGTFSFTYIDGVLDFTLDLTVDNDFSELQIYAGNDKLPKANNGKYKTAPGGLGYNESISSGVGSFSDEITGLSGDIYIAVHLGG
jgi:hypothetical protein